MGSKVISFRFDDDKLALLKQHQVEGESENQTAMRLLLGVLGVEGKKPSLQFVDIVDTIQAEIKSSLENGGIIASEIAKNYTAVMGNFNQLVDDIALLKSELSAIRSQKLGQLPITNTTVDNLEVSSQESENNNEQLTNNHHKIIAMLGIDNIIKGEKYNKNSLVLIREKMIKNKQQLEQELNIKLNLDNPNFVVRELNKILKSLGYQWENKQIDKIETYWIIP